MNEVRVSSSEVVRYVYSPQGDRLTLELAACEDPGESQALVDVPRIRVRHDPRTGEVVSAEVDGVQALILEHLVRDLVGLVRSAAAGHSAVPEAVAAPAVVARPERDTKPSPRPAPSPERGPAPPTEAGTMPLALEPTPSPEAGTMRSVPEPAPSPGREPTPPTEAGTMPLAPEPAPSPELEPAPPPELEPTPSPTLELAPSSELEPAPPPEAGTMPSAPSTPAPETTRRAGRRHQATQGPKPEPSPASPLPPELVARRDRAPATRLESEPGTGRAAKPAPYSGPALTDLPVPEGFRDLDLDPRVGGALAALGFVEPTPIQRRAIPLAMAGHDLIGLAQTGTGKTFAFLVPVVEFILADTGGDAAAGRAPRSLIVTPTRELAVQVGGQAEALVRGTPLSVAVVYGGAPMPAQTRALRQGADIVVATPGRLLDHIRQRHLRLDSVGVLVLDESDRMLDMGFMPDVRRIISLLPTDRQTLLFGATLPPDIESLSRQFQREPELVEVARQLPPATLEQFLYPVGRHLKVGLLVHLLRDDPALSRVLIFTETKVETDIVARKVKEAGLSVASMHGDRPQRDRERALRQLSSGDVQALVATNVAARGLDIEDVSHVINHDMPQSVDDYVHRVGRTARGEALGIAYTFVTPGDEIMVRRIESVLGRALPRRQAEGFDYDVPTPSWAQPSPQDVARSLRPASLASLSRSFQRRRR